MQALLVNDLKHVRSISRRLFQAQQKPQHAASSEGAFTAQPPHPVPQDAAIAAAPATAAVTAPPAVLSDGGVTAQSVQEAVLLLQRAWQTGSGAAAAGGEGSAAPADAAAAGELDELVSQLTKLDSLRAEVG